MHEGLLLVLMMLIASFFTGTEMGAYCVNRLRLRFRTEEAGGGSRLLSRMLADRETLVSTTLAGTNLCYYTATACLTALLVGRHVENAEFWSTLVLAPLLLVCTEILPKTLFTTHANALMYRVVHPLRVAMILLWPMAIILKGVMVAFDSLFGNAEPEGLGKLSLPRLEGFISDGRREGVISAEQDAMARNVMQLERITLRDVMVPIEQVAAIPRDADETEVRRVALENTYSRLPVHDGLRTSIIGVLALVEMEGNASGAGLCVVKKNGRAGCGAVISADPNHPPVVKGYPRPVTRLANIRAIASGGDHFCTLTTHGKVWCRGNNHRGQLGLGHLRERTIPTEIPGLKAVTALSAGWKTTCAVRQDGSVWCWGDGVSGQLGDGGKVCPRVDDDSDNPDAQRCQESRHSTKPVPVSGLTGAVDVQVTIGFACALRKDRTVWCWGANHTGQLGDGSTTARSQARGVSGLSGITQLSVGANHSCAVRSNGSLWCWGALPGTKPRPVPVQMSGLEAPQFVSAGTEHTCAIGAHGKVWCWGNNPHGQLGNGNTTTSSRPVLVQGLTGAENVVAMSRATCAVKSDGSLWCWGAIARRIKGGRVKVLTPRVMKLIGI